MVSTPSSPVCKTVGWKFIIQIAKYFWFPGLSYTLYHHHQF